MQEKHKKRIPPTRNHQHSKPRRIHWMHKKHQKTSSQSVKTEARAPQEHSSSVETEPRAPQEHSRSIETDAGPKSSKQILRGSEDHRIRVSERERARENRNDLRRTSGHRKPRALNRGADGSQLSSTSEHTQTHICRTDQSSNQVCAPSLSESLEREPQRIKHAHEPQSADPESDKHIGTRITLSTRSALPKGDPQSQGVQRSNQEFLNRPLDTSKLKF